MPRDLLTRDAFRERVFARDRHRCVVCAAPAQDAHHLLERRLFPDGGYTLDNGVSLCAADHRAAEATTIACEHLRAAAGIARVVLPPHLHPGRRYDKWGNPVRLDDRRLRGELFHEEPVQKALAPVLDLFLPRSEEPRPLHLPWSPGAAAGGGFTEADALAGLELVVLAEPDGEPLSIDADGLYVDTGDAPDDPPTHFMNLIDPIAELLPPGGRLCGIRRDQSFVVTSVWDGRGLCLPFDDAAELAELVGLPAVPVLDRAPGDLARLQALAPAWGPHRLRPAAAVPHPAYRRRVACYGPPRHADTPAARSHCDLARPLR